MRFVVLLIALSGCTQAPVVVDAGPAAPPTEVVLQGETMGSTYTIKIAVADASQVPAAQALQSTIDTTLERIVDVMSTYRPNSEISRFNNHKSTEPFASSEELLVVVAKALAIGHRTEGAYDITLDPLIALWGFDRRGRRTEAPSEAEIAAVRKHCGPDRVVVVGRSLQKSDPESTINLGGIASGYAVDVVASLIEAAGFHDFMVEITGEVKARGKNARGSAWTIGVKVPRSDDDPTSVAAAVPLVNQSLTTSGSYHNFFESKGKRYSHILDPKTGRPIVGDLVSVTVLYPDALTADGFDTPFMILGEEKARAIIAGYAGMEALFIHATPTGAMTITKTAGFPAIDVPTGAKQ
jgi:thiamine biosynthesis lipoprotein